MDDQRAGKPAGSGQRMAFSAVLVVALVLVAAVGLYASRHIAARRSAAAALDSTIERLEVADERVAAIDELIASAPESTLETRALEAVPVARSTGDELQGISAAAERLIPRLAADERERARLLAEAARARHEMLAEAPALLTLLAQASRALGPAGSAWERVLKADRLTRRAVRSFNQHTASSVRSALRLHEQSAEELDRARAELVAAEEAFPRAPMELFIAYVDARRELAAHARRAGRAWLEGRITASNDAIESYNVGDARAVAQARSLPSSPAEAIRSAFQRLASERLGGYRRARERAVRADERLKVR